MKFNIYKPIVFIECIIILFLISYILKVINFIPIFIDNNSVFTILFSFIIISYLSFVNLKNNRLLRKIFEENENITEKRYFFVYFPLIIFLYYPLLLLKRMLVENSYLINFQYYLDVLLMFFSIFIVINVFIFLYLFLQIIFFYITNNEND